MSTKDELMEMYHSLSTKYDTYSDEYLKGMVYIPSKVYSQMKLYQEIGEQSDMSKEVYDAWIYYIKFCRRNGLMGMFA